MSPTPLAASNIELSVRDRPLTWASVHDVPSIRTDILGAMFPSGATTAFLVGLKRVLVVDLLDARVTARHTIGHAQFLGALEEVMVLCAGTELRFEQVSAAGTDRVARLNLRKEAHWDGTTFVGATPVSKSQWWVASRKKLLLVDLVGERAEVVTSWSLPFAADQILVDPAVGLAVAMDTSVGLTGSSACSLRLSDGTVSARAPAPTGRMVWDDAGSAAILDERASLVHRLSPDLHVAETVALPTITTTAFPIRACQVSPGEVLVLVTAPEGPSSLLHLGWGSGVERALARRSAAVTDITRPQT